MKKVVCLSLLLSFFGTQVTLIHGVGEEIGPAIRALGREISGGAQEIWTGVKKHPVIAGAAITGVGVGAWLLQYTQRWRQRRRALNIKEKLFSLKATLKEKVMSLQKSKSDFDSMYRKANDMYQKLVQNRDVIRYFSKQGKLEYNSNILPVQKGDFLNVFADAQRSLEKYKTQQLQLLNDLLFVQDAGFFIDASKNMKAVQFLLAPIWLDVVKELMTYESIIGNCLLLSDKRLKGLSVEQMSEFIRGIYAMIGVTLISGFKSGKYRKDDPMDAKFLEMLKRHGFDV